jgi:hypothetical protein
MFKPVALPPGRLRRATKPAFHRIAADHEDDRNGLGCGHGRHGRHVAAGRGEDIDPQTGELGGELRQPIVLAVGPAQLGPDIAADDIALLAQPLIERRYHPSERRRCSAIEDADHRNRRLLRARRQRQGGNRSQNGDDVAPPHELPFAGPIFG